MYAHTQTHAGALQANASDGAEHTYRHRIKLSKRSANISFPPRHLGYCLIGTHKHKHRHKHGLLLHTHAPRRGYVHTVSRASHAQNVRGTHTAATLHAGGFGTSGWEAYLLVLAPRGPLFERRDVPQRQAAGEVDDGQQGAVGAQAHAENAVLHGTKRRRASSLLANRMFTQTFHKCCILKATYHVKFILPMFSNDNPSLACQWTPQK